MTWDCRNRLTRTWFLLVVLTLSSMALTPTVFAPLVVSAAVLLAAAMKAWWISLGFLELRDAPAGWRVALAVWVVLTAAGAWVGLAISDLV